MFLVVNFATTVIILRVVLSKACVNHEVWSMSSKIEDQEKYGELLRLDNREGRYHVI